MAECGALRCAVRCSRPWGCTGACVRWILLPACLLGYLPAYMPAYTYIHTTYIHTHIHTHYIYYSASCPASQSKPPTPLTPSSPLTGANSCTSRPAKLTETWHSRPLPMSAGPSSPCTPQVCVEYVYEHTYLLRPSLHPATSWPWPRHAARPSRYYRHTCSIHTPGTHQHSTSISTGRSHLAQPIACISS